MSMNNDAFEGESTFELDAVDLKTARQNGHNAVVSTEEESNRLDLSEIAGTDDIASNFDTEKSYYQGDFVYYDGQLYCAKVDMDAGSFDPTKWEISQISSKKVDVSYKHKTGTLSFDLMCRIPEIPMLTESGEEMLTESGETIIMED